MELIWLGAGGKEARFPAVEGAMSVKMELFIGLDFPREVVLLLL